MSRSIHWLILGLLVWQPMSINRVGAEEPSRFFGLTNLWILHLTLSSTQWSALEPKGQGGRGMSDRDFPWSECAFSVAGHTLSNVAIRFKGNSSFNASRGRLKRPLKLDFNRGFKGREFLGMGKLFLNNNFNDVTQLREALAYDAYRQAGLPASRTAFAKVYLTLTGERTNEYLGLYTLVEAVDNDFLTAHFGTNQGLLLKPERLPGLEYLGEDWRNYTTRYDPKTSVEPADAQRFIALTRLIAEADEATLARELPTRLDLDNFLRYVAVTAILANYDSFVGNGHNYYLFQPVGGAKAVFIPWDLNEALGGHPMAGSRADQAELSVLRPQASRNRLIERVLANPLWAAAYRREVAGALTNACASARLKANAEQIILTIQDAVFTESAIARATFQRIALGQIQQPLPARDRMSDRRDLGSGPFPGLGGEELPLGEWIERRIQNVADELSGKRILRPARLQNFPGGPAGPGGPERRRPDEAGGPQRKGPRDPMAENLFPPDLVLLHQQEIGLRPDQREFIEAILEEVRPGLQEAERRVGEATEKLAVMLETNPVDEPAILAQSDMLADAEKKVRRIHLGLMLRIKNSLRPEQQAKLRDLKSKRTLP